MAQLTQPMSPDLHVYTYLFNDYYLRKFEAALNKIQLTNKFNKPKSEKK